MYKVIGMDDLKNATTVIVGAIMTFLSNYIDIDILGHRIQVLITILVGIATLAYTIQKMVEIHYRIKREREGNFNDND